MSWIFFINIFYIKNQQFLPFFELFIIKRKQFTSDYTHIDYKYLFNIDVLLNFMCIIVL